MNINKPSKMYIQSFYLEYMYSINKKESNFRKALLKTQNFVDLINDSESSENK